MLDHCTGLSGCALLPSRWLLEGQGEEEIETQGQTTTSALGIHGWKMGLPDRAHIIFDLSSRFPHGKEPFEEDILTLIFRLK